jgi:hypothetical protein
MRHERDRTDLDLFCEVYPEDWDDGQHRLLADPCGPRLTDLQRTSVRDSRGRVIARPRDLFRPTVSPRRCGLPLRPHC